MSPPSPDPRIEVLEKRVSELEQLRTFMAGVVFASTTIGGALVWLYHQLKDYLAQLAAAAHKG